MIDMSERKRFRKTRGMKANGSGVSKTGKTEEVIKQSKRIQKELKKPIH